MKQIFENLKIREIELLDVPALNTGSSKIIVIYANNFVGVIDNFASAEAYKGGGVRRKKLLRQNKGFVNEYEEVLNALRKGDDFPIDFNDIIYTTLTTFALKETVQTEKPIEIKEFMKRADIGI